MGVVRVVPVQQGVIEPHLDPLRPEGVEIFPHQIPAAGGHRRVIGQFRVEQAEAVVVLGGEHGILHSGPFGGFGPFFRVVFRRVKGVEVGLVLFVGHPLVLLDPFPPGGDGVQPPVDEHSEPGPREPICAVGHDKSPFVPMFLCYLLPYAGGK